MAETDFLRRSLNNPRFNTFTASGFAGSGGGGGSTTSEDDLKQAVMAIQPGGPRSPLANVGVGDGGTAEESPNTGPPGDLGELGIDVSPGALGRGLGSMIGSLTLGPIGGVLGGLFGQLAADALGGDKGGGDKGGPSTAAAPSPPASPGLASPDVDAAEERGASPGAPAGMSTAQSAAPGVSSAQSAVDAGFGSDPGGEFGGGGFGGGDFGGEFGDGDFGGEVGGFRRGGLVPAVDYRNGGFVRGAGDGNDDAIQANVSAGEFVIPSDIVAALGEGSTEAGARLLADMVAQVRGARAQQLQSLPPPRLPNGGQGGTGAPARPVSQLANVG